MMSSPSITSGFKEEAPASSLYRIAGLRLAYRSRPARIANRPLSGLNERSMLSHWGPPTAPNKIASDCFPSASVSSGSGTPVSSIALPPINACSVEISSLCFSTRALSTFSASVTISGPIPSPGSINTLLLTSNTCC